MSDKIVIKFKPEGDRKLVKAIERLAAAQNKLEKELIKLLLQAKSLTNNKNLLVRGLRGILLHLENFNLL